MASFVILKLCMVALLVSKRTGSSVPPSQAVSCSRGPSDAETTYCDQHAATVVPEGANGNTRDVTFFKRCVQVYFGLEPASDEEKKNFKIPQFKPYLKYVEGANPQNPKWLLFEKIALRIQRYFLRNKNWEATKDGYREDLPRLLRIANARYLYVTYLLYVRSGHTMTACSHTPDGKFRFPEGVCFIPPYGTTSATSDYDVGLIGTESGSVAALFNSEFQTAYGVPSEIVFDTNIYGYSLEYAMPVLFTGLSTFYNHVMPRLDFEGWAQMLELAGAYFKMFRFYRTYYTEYRDYARQNLGHDPGVIDRRGHFNHWIAEFAKYNGVNKFAAGRYASGELFREAHNAQYGEILTTVRDLVSSGLRDTEKITEFVTQMSIALVYAAEAYHTKGAMRHVVGVLQLKNKQVNDNMAIMDYWVSMIENWADANKGFSHCGTKPAKKCLLTMAKYLYRTFAALKIIHKTITNFPVLSHALNALFTSSTPSPFTVLGKPPYPHLDDNTKDPEMITKKWVAEFKGKESEIPRDGGARQFLNYFGCTTQSRDSQLVRSCMDKINTFIKKFNDLLILTTGRPTLQDTILYKKNGQKKTLSK